MKRGPYYNRQEEYTRACELRNMGYGYHSIANELDIPWSTIRNWVKDIPVDKIEAQRLAYLKSRPPFEKLTSKGAIRKRLIEERGIWCEFCGEACWNGEPLTMEVHHIDGNGKNNHRDNLQLLCPNCHSQTDNYRNKRV